MTDDHIAGAAAADDIERLVRAGGRRQIPDAARRERARAIVHDAWRDTLRARTRRRWTIIAAPPLAVAATLALALALWPRTAPPPAAPVVVAHLAVSTGGVHVPDGAGLRTISANDVVHAGAVIETPPGVVATFALDGGGELRQNGGTSVRWLAPRQVAIDRGQIYLDSGGAPLTVGTVAGVVRNIGTRFAVQVRAGEVRVRVREGAVRLESAAESHEATAGRELVAGDGRGVTGRPIRTFGAEWDWILRATPFRLEGATLAHFLAWVEREGGRQVEFRPPQVRTELAATVLHGSIQGLSMDEAIATILPAAGLSHRLEAGRVIVEPAGGGVRK